MKLRKKSNNPLSFSNILPEQIFEDRSKMSGNQYEELSNNTNNDHKEVNLGNVSNLDVIDDIEVSNFQFVNFNKLDLESLDIINEDTIAKEELFYSVVDNLINETDKNTNEVGYSTHAMSPDALDVSSSNCNETPKISLNCNATKDFGKAPVENRRAVKRRQTLERSKVQCPVRTTAKHYTKMLEFFEANPGLATGQLPKVIYRKKWRKLTDILNEQGIGEKTTEKWQKTWSDYKLHLRKKVSGIKRSGKALDVPNQFTDLDKRALNNIGVSFFDEDSKIAIRKRFNPDTLENEDSSSSSHSTAQSVQSTTHSNLPTSTTDGSPVTNRKSTKQQLRHKKLLYRRDRLREFRDYHSRTLKELSQLRLTVNDGLTRIGDILERLVTNSENNNNTTASSLVEVAAQITATATNLAEVLQKNITSNNRY